MKQLFTTLVTILIFSFASYAQSGAGLDNEKGTSMKPIIDPLKVDVESLEKENLEIVHIEYDLLFDKDTKEVYRDLSDSYTYAIMAYGDYRIAKVGLDLYKESGTTWEFVKSGEFADGLCSLIYKVETSGSYKIVIRPLQMTEGYTVGHYGLYVMHE